MAFRAGHSTRVAETRRQTAHVARDWELSPESLRLCTRQAEVDGALAEDPLTSRGVRVPCRPAQAIEPPPNRACLTRPGGVPRRPTGRSCESPN